MPLHVHPRLDADLKIRLRSHPDVALAHYSDLNPA